MKLTLLPQSGNFTGSKLRPGALKKMLLVMKLTAFILLITLTQISAKGVAQTVTISRNNISLGKVFRDIHKQTGYNFLCTQEQLSGSQKVSLDLKNVPLKEVLDYVFKDQPLAYSILNKTIIVRHKPVVKGQKEFTSLLLPTPITGTVKDSATGNPLVGVTIQVKGNTMGTTTDVNGHFNLEVPDDAVIVVSYLGYKKKEIAVNGKTTFNVILANETTGLNQLVVVGYGTQKKVSLTTAVSAISGDEISERHAPNLEASLQGMAPGLTVWDKGGEPGGSSIDFKIRGVTTLNNSSPLIIVDGIEQSSFDINPNEIASVSILKDAASTAIYGSRAANGVVLITTKRGHKGAIKVRYNGWIDFQNLVTIPEHMDTRSYLELQNLAYKNRGSNPLYTEEDIEKYVSGEDRLHYPLPNTWFNTVVKKNAPWFSHSLDISGGGEHLNTLLSMRYMDQDGIYPNHSMQRYQLRMNNDIEITKNLTANADIKVRRQNRSTTNNGSLYHWMIHGSQFAVPRYPDGTYGLSKQGNSPLAYTDPDIVGGTNSQSDNAVINLQANWEIVKGLSLHEQYAIEVDKYNSLATYPTFQIKDYWHPGVILKENSINSLTKVEQQSMQKTWNTTLNYDFSLNGIHDFNLLAGYSEISYSYDDLTGTGRDFYNNDILDLGQSNPQNRGLGSAYQDWGLRSAFGRLKYGYRQKYLLEINMRYDGSSRFPQGDRYSFFPSISGAWLISEESFWQPIQNWLDLFKVRASWGKNGNQNVGLYSYFDNLNIANYYNFNGQPVVGVLQTEFASQNLSWESTTQTDIGVDMEFFQGKFGVTFDWYKKLTKGILLNLPIPGIVGLNPSPSNAGNVENIGWELNLSYKNTIGDLRYSITGNISDVRNEILNLAGTGPYYSGEKNWFVRKVGQPIDALWGYKTDGYYTEEDFDKGYPTLSPDAKPGDIKYVDLNNDGKINSDDRMVLGSTIPRLTFGANIGLQYKNFDLNMLWQGVGKQNMAIMGAYIENGSWEGFTLAIGKDYWTPEHTDALFPRPQKQSDKNTEPSDHWVLNGSYVRLKNFQLGYEIPKKITSRVGISLVRIYVGGTNLLTFSKLKKWGMDAETPTGRDAYYPPVKTYTVGLNLDF